MSFLAYLTISILLLLLFRHAGKEVAERRTEVLAAYQRGFADGVKKAYGDVLAIAVRLKAAVAQPQPGSSALTNTPGPLEDGQNLDRQVAHDALLCAERAKAALTAVLRGQGCSDAQIEKVMETIENREAGG